MPPKRDEIAESKDIKKPSTSIKSDPEAKELALALVDFLKNLKNIED